MSNFASRSELFIFVMMREALWSSGLKLESWPILCIEPRSSFLANASFVKTLWGMREAWGEVRKLRRASSDGAVTLNFSWRINYFLIFGNEQYLLLQHYNTTWIVRTCQTTFVLVAEEVLRGPAAPVPVALTKAGGGVEGPLRDSGLAAGPRPPDRRVVAHRRPLEARPVRDSGAGMWGPELGKQLGAPLSELLLHRLWHRADVSSEEEGAWCGLGQYLSYAASSCNIMESCLWSELLWLWLLPINSNKQTQRRKTNISDIFLCVGMTRAKQSHCYVRLHDNVLHAWYICSLALARPSANNHGVTFVISTQRI